MNDEFKSNFDASYLIIRFWEFSLDFKDRVTNNWNLNDIIFSTEKSFLTLNVKGSSCSNSVALVKKNIY